MRLPTADFGAKNDISYGGQFRRMENLLELAGLGDFCMYSLYTRSKGFQNMFDLAMASNVPINNF